MSAIETWDGGTVVAQARTWLKTPYHHQGVLKHVGVDCIGLVRGVFLELNGYDPKAFNMPPYSPFWAEANEGELLLTGCREHLVEQPPGAWEVGDVLVFRVMHAKSAKHCGIVVGDDMMIHAWSRQAVIETSIGYWRKAVAGIFKYPKV